MVLKLDFYFRPTAINMSQKQTSKKLVKTLITKDKWQKMQRMNIQDALSNLTGSNMSITTDLFQIC